MDKHNNRIYHGLLVILGPGVQRALFLQPQLLLLQTHAAASNQCHFESKTFHGILLLLGLQGKMSSLHYSDLKSTCSFWLWFNARLKVLYIINYQG